MRLTLDNLPQSLCQPDERKSCGACCGMYNHRHANEQATWDRLWQRTDRFQRDVDINDEQSLRNFRRKWEPVGSTEKLLIDLPNCPFLGFLGVDCATTPSKQAFQNGVRPKVGCMVHPLQNNGVDARDCGVYDRQTCEGYLCAAHDFLTREERWLILSAVNDSYLYGLLLTEVRFTKELFKAAARINGHYPTWGQLNNEQVVQAASEYFELKRDWPYAAIDGVFGQMVAGQGLETFNRSSPSESLDVAPVEFDIILRCLGTDVRTTIELETANDLVSQAVYEFAKYVATS